MGERRNNPQPQPPSEITAEFRGLVENMAQPAVIMDGAGKIRFMNPCAERLLAGGLKERVEAHLKNPAQRKPVSQVRFPLDGASEIILQIKRSDMEWQWQGQPATLMSLTDVTADIATARRLTQEIAKSKGRDSVSAASFQPIVQETSPFQKSWEEALAQRGQPEAQLNEPAAEKDRVEPSHRTERPEPREAAPEAEPVREKLNQAGGRADELTLARGGLEARAGQSLEEQWSALRKLQAAATESESRAAAAQQQSGAEIAQARAERRQAQDDAQQLRVQLAEANQQRDNARVELEKVKEAWKYVSQEVSAAQQAQAQLAAQSAQLQIEVEARKRAEGEALALRQAVAEARTALEELAARRDQYKASAEQRAEELRQQIARQQQAEEEMQQLRQKLAKSVQSVETFRTGFEALKAQAEASADEVAKENQALRRNLAEHEREEEALRTMIKNLSVSGKTFFGALEQFKADGQAPPRPETPGTSPEGGENR